MAQAPIQVVWFKRDLRIHDHAPLANAAAVDPTLPLFAIEPGHWQASDSALRHWQFAADALVDLSHALETQYRCARLPRISPSSPLRCLACM